MKVHQVGQIWGAAVVLRDPEDGPDRDVPYYTYVCMYISSHTHMCMGQFGIPYGQ